MGKLGAAITQIETYNYHRKHTRVFEFFWDLVLLIGILSKTGNLSF